MKSVTKWIVGIAGVIVYVPLILGGDKVADKLLTKAFSVPLDMYLVGIICICALAILLSYVSKWDRS